MKLIKFLIELPVRFAIALVGFTWRMDRLAAHPPCAVLRYDQRSYDWSWWLALLPLEYGVIYCAYMTIDGALYRAGAKRAGRYARFTQGLE